MSKLMRRKKQSLTRRWQNTSPHILQKRTLIDQRSLLLHICFSQTQSVLRLSRLILVGDRLEVPLLDYSITDVSKEIGKLWKEVSEEEKEVDIVFLFHCRLWRNSIGRQK